MKKEKGKKEAAKKDRKRLSLVIKLLDARLAPMAVDGNNGSGGSSSWSSW